MSKTSRSTQGAVGQPPSGGAGWPLFAVPACFFLSGAAGLIYEVLWVRLIDKVIGGAPFAVATVLSVFMAGLALGSLVAGRCVDRFSSRAALLALYGKLEIGIGVYALVLPFLIAAATPFYRLIYDPLLNHFWCYQALAFLGCALLLILPSGLMGATLPLLCRFYVNHLGHLGGRTGRLYGLNTAGAALGAVLCGFVLVKSLGVWATVGIAAGLNLFVGLVCLGLSRHRAVLAGKDPSGGRTSFPSASSPLEATSADHGGGRETPWALLLFAVSGFCALAYEVLWIRLLGLIVGPTTYSFTLVVTTFIIGLALGSVLFGWLADRVKRVFLLLVLTQLCASVLALGVTQVLGNSQFLFAKLIHTFHGSFPALILAQSLVLGAILLGPTLFLGAAFPLVTRICVHSLAGLGRTLGTAYALNTLGAILGSLAAGYLLIPLLGKEDGLRLVILAQFVAAALALVRTGTGRKRRLLGGIAGGVLTLGYALLLLGFPAWRGDLLSRGWYRDFGAIEHDLDRAGWFDALRKGPDLLAGQRKGLDVLFYGEGSGGFTTVEREVTSLGTVEYAMFNSGKADASSHGDRSTQTLSAHIPLLFHPKGQDVMVLGLASGMTAGEVLLYPVRRLDILEINEQVVRACQMFFAPWNNACLEDPRTRLIVQDGRNHLTLTHEMYDIIISEPSNPWMAGLSNLYSLEFFQTVRRRLKENGLFAQWIQSYEIDWDTFCLLGRTFAKAFPEAALIKIGPVDYLLLGFKNGKGLDWQSAEKNLPFARRSRNVSFSGVNFLAHLILTEDLPALFGPGPLHTDNRPRLEFSAPMKLYGGTLNIDRALAGWRRLSPRTHRRLEAGRDADTLLDLVEFSASANIPVFDVLDPHSLTPEQRERYAKALSSYCSRVLVPAYGILRDPESKVACAEVQIERIRRKISAAGRPADHYNLGLALSAAGRTEEAARAFEAALRLDPRHEGGSMALGLLLAQAGQLDRAVRCFERLIETGPDRAEPYKYLGMVEMRRGRLERAVANLSKARQLAPDDPAVSAELGLTHLRRGDYAAAIASLSEALDRDPSDLASRRHMALALFRAGDLEKARGHLSTVLQIDPTDAQTRSLLDRVERRIRSGKDAPGG